MEGRHEASPYFKEYLTGSHTKHLLILNGRCWSLTDHLLKKGAAKVEVNDNERFTLYVELPEDKDKWIPIMVEITNAHPQKIFHLVEGDTTVIKVAMVDGLEEIKQ